MRDPLARLAAALYQPGPAPAVPVAEVAAFVARAMVVIPAGGFGTRMAGGGDTPRQKALLPLPNGETLIDRLIRQYRAAGVRRFLALVNYGGEAVVAHLGDGSRWNAEIAYSFDPAPEGVGRGGAIRHALAQGVIAPPAYVHNADCQLIGHPGSLPHELAAGHLAARAAAPVVATLAAVEGSPYPYTGLAIAGGRVTAVEMYPFVPIPTHAGITLIDAEALADLATVAPDAGESFEAVLFPRWAAAGRLAATLLRYEHWVAVDDRKAYARLWRYLEANPEPPASR